MVPRLLSYGRYISQLNCFARCCTNVNFFDFPSKNLQIIKLLSQCCIYHKLRVYISSSVKLLENVSDLTLNSYKNLVLPFHHKDGKYDLAKV